MERNGTIRRITLIAAIITAIVLVLVIAAFLNWDRGRSDGKNSSARLGQNVSAELAKHDITVTSGIVGTETKELTTDYLGQWPGKLITLTCEEGGYNLAAHEGETVRFDSYNTGETYVDQGTRKPLTIQVVSRDGEVICLFKTQREGGELIPGIWPVTEKNF